MQKNKSDNQEVRRLQLRIERLEKIQKAQIKLIQNASKYSAFDFLGKFLDETKRITGSAIGFFHYYDEKTKIVSQKIWSTHTIQSNCMTDQDFSETSSVDAIDLWADCINARKPAICNDHNSSPDKKSIPQCPNPIIRFISVPVFRDNKIMAVCGLANKKTDYTEDDVETIKQLAGLAWETATRKYAEESIFLANKSMNSLLHASPIGMGVAKDRVIITTNEKLSQITGYSLEELTGFKTRRFYENDEEYKRLGEEQHKQIDESGVCEVDTVFVCKNGKRKNVRFYSAPIDANNYDAGRSFAIVDISQELKSREQQQRYSDSLDAIFDAVPNILVITDDDGKIIRINQKGMHFIGKDKSKEDYVGMHGGNILKCIHSQDVQCGSNSDCVFCPLRNSINAVFTYGKASQKKGRLLFDDNGELIEKDLLISASPLEYEGKKTALISLTDISQIIENERTLERHQRAITLTNQIAEIFLTSEGKITHNKIVSSVLDTLESRYGYFGFINDSGDLICSSVTKSETKSRTRKVSSHTFTRQRWEELWGASLKENRSIRNDAEQTIPEIDVSLCNLLAVPIIYRNSIIGQFVVANKENGYDAYDQELLENAALHVAPILHAVLEKEKQEKERKSLEIQFMQSQRLESVGRLAGGVAHDLNNMLVPILGYAEMLVEDTEQEDPRYDFAREILEASTKASSIVRQLLAFSRKQTLETKPININTLLAEFEKLLRRTIREDIIIDMFLENNLPSIIGDSNQLEQVIMNLAVNAQDAMPRGGSLIFETKVIDVDQQYISKQENIIAGKYVYLSISDSGQGMEPTVAEQIFEPFFTTKSKYEGSGLGLATAYGIIKQHGGNISVYSEVNNGTTFKIYLPVYTKSTDIQEKHDPDFNNLTTKSGTILLVEDNLEVLNLTKKILKRSGYKVYAATRGSDALNICHQHAGEIHLLLTDVIMPNMDGKTLASRVKSIFPEIKTLFMSGYSGKIVSHRGILNQNTLFIQKPFTAKQLLEKIDEVL